MNVTGFQLLSVTMPTTFADSIIASQVQNQRQKQQEFQQQVAQVQSNIYTLCKKNIVF
jgi:hypothetical protein